MTTEIKRDEIAKIFKQLNECKKTLKQANIHSCLLSFKAVLEKTLSTQMLPSDEKELMAEVNAFQQALSESKNFKDVFGPVSFQGQDFGTFARFCQAINTVLEKKGYGTMPIFVKKMTYLFKILPLLPQTWRRRHKRSCNLLIRVNTPKQKNS